MRALLIVTVVLFAVRMWATAHVGFGDSEALYASWAAHPQPAYLDHPGLIGLLARIIGEGAMPGPGRAHVLTSLVATLLPWLVALVARAAGASRSAAAGAGVVVAVVPEIAVGLFALTPDLILAPVWLATIGLVIVGLDDDGSPGETRIEPKRAAALIGAGLLAGIAASAKVSGFLLAFALAAIYGRLATKSDKTYATYAARSMWAWAGLAAGAIVVVPFVFYEVRLGYPMLHHRFIDTQLGAGLAVANVGALVGGQLLYLSPVLFWVAIVVARDLWRRRNADVVSQILFAMFAIPLVPLLVLCAWSPVAEPHWIAPALLALPIHAARRVGDATFRRPRLIEAAAVTATLMTAGAYAWVLVPASARLVPNDVDPKLDIASELYGWPTAIDSVHEQMALAGTAFDPEGRDIVVVGPHWTVCAQLHAALPGIRVGCATPIPDDFDRWVQRDVWRGSDNVLFVTDNRFPGDGAEQLPSHVRVSQSRVRVLRGGRVARTFELYLYSRRGSALR